VKDLGQEEAWAEAVRDGAAAEDLEEGLQQARGAIASAPTAARKWLMNWESPATSRNVPSAARP